MIVNSNAGARSLFMSVPLLDLGTVEMGRPGRKLPLVQDFRLCILIEEPADFSI